MTVLTGRGHLCDLSRKAPVTPGWRPGYNLPAIEKCWNRGQIVERTYDWSQRSWVIARGKSVATRSMVIFKTCNLRFLRIGTRTIDGTIGRTMLRLIVRSVVRCFDCSYDRSFGATIATIDLRSAVGSNDRSLDQSYHRATDHCTPRLIVRSVTGCHDCSYDRSQDATIDRTIGRRPSRLIV